MDNFEQLTIPQLKSILSEKKIPGRSKLTKKFDIIIFLRKYLNKEEGEKILSIDESIRLSIESSRIIEEKERVKDDFEMNKQQEKYYFNICQLANDRGWKVKSKAYKNHKVLMAFICPKGHEIWTSPTYFRDKENPGSCKSCQGTNFQTGERNFREAIEKLGGIVLGDYKGSHVPVNCRCEMGHNCSPLPLSIRKDRGMCRTCAGNDPKVAETNFRKNIENLGGTVIGSYVNNSTPIKCICNEGHECEPTPAYVRKGQGICRICSECDPKTTEDNFRKLIDKLGGEVIGEYVNVSTPIECLCPKGHKCSPTPMNVRNRLRMCRICAGTCPEVGEANFQKNIENLGGTIIGKYINAKTPIECKCKQGHKCNPIPDYIKRGNGMCLTCIRLQIESKGSKIVRQTLLSLAINFTTEWNAILPELPKRRYDFMFIHDRKKYIIEFDGGQHFKQSNWHKSEAHFLHSQEIDRLKNYVANYCGYNIIRISSENENDIAAFIWYCLHKLSETPFLEVDDEERYRYQIQVKVNQETIKKYCPSLVTFVTDGT